MIDIVLIGAGLWGQNYIRTCKDFPLINLVVATKENWQSLIDKKPHGAIISTQPEHHIEIAKFCLERKVPVIIEKPLALSLDEAMALLPYSHDILVNHIHLFSDNYLHIKKLVENTEIKEIVTCGTGTVKRPYSNLYDYGVHDLSMILDLLKSMPDTIVFDRVVSKEQDFYNINMKFGETSVRSRVGYDLKKVRTLSITSKDLYLHYNALNSKKNKQTPLHNVISVFINHIINEKKDNRIGLSLSLKILKILNSYSS